MEKIKQLIIKRVAFLYPYILSIYPIISIYYNNINEIFFNQLLLPIVFISVINLLFYSILKKVTEIDIISIIIIGFWCIIFYYLNFIKLFHVIFENDIYRKRYIIFWFIGISFIIYILTINKTLLARLNKILGVYTFILFTIVFSKISIFHYDNKPITFDNKAFTDNTLILNNNEKLHDIYCIILDGYPGLETLKSKFFFENEDFITHLRKNKFHVFTNSRSNYTVTFLSMASLLNMEYVNFLSNKNTISSIDRAPAYDLISNNKVVSFLKEKKYKFINISSGWGPTDNFQNADINIKYNKYINEFVNVLINASLIKEIFNFIDIDVNSDFVNVNYSLESITKVKKIKGPKFVLAHILSPHDSYIYNSDGTPSEYINQKSKFNKIQYVNSLVSG
jgi:hypothetical protein